MIEDEIVFLWRDYWRAFARMALKATGWGILICNMSGDLRLLGLHLCAACIP